jgi:transmembrane sensor
MDQQEAARLLEKYIDKTATAQERHLVDTWYNNEAAKRQLTDADSFEHLADELWLGTRARAGLNPVKKIHKAWYWLSAAVVLLFGLSLAYIALRPDSETKLSAQTSQIKPGTNKAVLTLANGKKIYLNNATKGKLAEQNNTSVNKTDSGKIVYQAEGKTAENALAYNTITTPAGGQFQLTLADGTSVTLDASSSITYPVTFTGKQRLVTMKGQVYFEVAHNSNKPFVVSTQGQSIEVLGTHFNVNAYDDEPLIKTTLLTGSIKLKVAEHQALLKPGQQGVVQVAATTIDIKDADIEETMAWQKGYFRFHQEEIHSIMRKLARWYNIDVTFEGPTPTEKYSGTISRYKNINQVLSMLEYSKSVHFKVSGRRVTVLE